MLKFILHLYLRLKKTIYIKYYSSICTSCLILCIICHFFKGLRQILWLCCKEDSCFICLIYLIEQQKKILKILGPRTCCTTKS